MRNRFQNENGARNVSQEPTMIPVKRPVSSPGGEPPSPPPVPPPRSSPRLPPFAVTWPIQVKRITLIHIIVIGDAEKMKVADKEIEGSCRPDLLLAFFNYN
jgi:hypothetical protein